MIVYLLKEKDIAAEIERIAADTVDEFQHGQEFPGSPRLREMVKQAIYHGLMASSLHSQRQYEAKRIELHNITMGKTTIPAEKKGVKSDEPVSNTECEY